MSEQVFLQSPEFTVTSTRVVSGSTTYAVANITSATIRGEPGAHRNARIALLLFGAIAVLCWSTDHYIIAAICTLIGLGALGAAFKPYELVLTTGAAEQHALKAMDRGVIERAAQAVSDAIIARR